MPNYDYKCKKCSYVFEIFQSMTAPRLKTCPKCGSGVERLIGSGGGFIFKGSGFYATDYKKSAPKSGGEVSGECKKCADNTCPAKKEKKK